MILETINELSDGQIKRRRISIVSELRLEFARNLAACFLSKDLLTSNPTVFVNERDPILDNVYTKVIIPFSNHELMEPFVPIMKRRLESSFLVFCTCIYQKNPRG